MRSMFTILVLICFVLRHFSCCAECCDSCANANEAKVDCPIHQHDHDHEHEVPAPADGSHHICMATHLFFLTHGKSLPPLPDFSVWDAVSPSIDASLDRRSANPIDTLGLHSLPPRAAQRMRAVLSVWVV